MRISSKRPDPCCAKAMCHAVGDSLVRGPTKVKRATTLLLLAAAALFLGRLTAPSEDRSDETGDLVLMLILVLPVAAAHALVALEVVRQRRWRPIGYVWRGLLAGATAGILLGIGLRVGMRAVAIAAGQPTDFSVGGSFLVLGIGVFFGASFGSLFAAVRSLLPGRTGGITFGFLAGTLFWFPFFHAAAGDLRGVVGEPVIALLTSVLSALWVGYGAVLEWLMRLRERAVAATS